MTYTLSPLEYFCQGDGGSSNFVLVALACSFIPVATVTAPTAQPTADGSGSIRFQDGFSNFNSGGGRTQDASYSTDCENGGYRINIVPESYTVFVNPYQSFQNIVRIEVDAIKIVGQDDNNAYGVICRYQDVDHYYYFYISSDGYVGIGIDNAGTKSFISSSDGNRPASRSSTLVQPPTIWALIVPGIP